MVHRYDAEIELLIDDETDLIAEIEANAVFDEKANVSIARVESLINTYKQKQQTRSSLTSSSSATSTANTMKLPKLQLPTFTGAYTDWMSFIDLFTASVDSNSQLSDSEKLNYLRACLKGDAARLISSMTIIDSNYSIALRLLRERYENKRCIVQAHLKAIWSQPVMKGESGIGLRKILETTNEHLRALQELGEPVEHWDSLLIFWLVEKLDPESKKQWQLSNPGTDVPKWEVLVRFLDTRSRALEHGNFKETPQTATSSKVATNAERRIQSYSSVSACSEACEETHKLHNCPSFRNMSVSDRMKIVRSRRACFNCLQSGHNLGDCTSKYTCRECKLKHHTLLYREKPQQGGTAHSN